MPRPERTGRRHRARGSLALLACSSCSFFLVHAPDRTAANPNVEARTCTSSTVVPTIDAAAGALLLAGAAGGEIVDHFTSHTVHDYELIVGLPLVIAGITYLVAANHGNNAVEACEAASEHQLRGCDGCAPNIP